MNVLVSLKPRSSVARRLAKDAMSTTPNPLHKIGLLLGHKSPYSPCQKSTSGNFFFFPVSPPNKRPKTPPRPRPRDFSPPANAFVRLNHGSGCILCKFCPKVCCLSRPQAPFRTIHRLLPSKPLAKDSKTLSQSPNTSESKPAPRPPRQKLIFI